MDGIYGLVANSVSIVLTHPIDVVKTNYQLYQIKNTYSSVNSNSTIVSITKNIFQTRGVKGFYSGITPNLMTYPIFWAVYFGTNQTLNDHKYSTNMYVNKFINSYISGTIGSTFTNPLFVIKTRMQNTSRENASVISTIRDVNKIGFNTYFKGLNATFLNNTKLALQFPLYDCIKNNTDSVLSASFGSKIISSTIMYPLDLFRTIQRNSDTKLNLIDVMKSIHAKNGLIGFYRGVILYNAVSTPNFVIMMYLFELMKKYQ